MKGRRILIGVSGGIATYKVCEVVSTLAKAGAEVKAILTDAAGEFVTPLTFDGKIEGFELNKVACKIAESQIKEYELSEQYTVNNCSFFDSPLYESADCVISNPPYLPAVDDKIYQPLLHGGSDGCTIAKKLLSLGCDEVLLMVSSYSNPVGLIDYALARGYSVANFEIAPLNFGYYSSEPKVKSAIATLREQGMAFYSENIYLLAGVLFKKQQKSQRDLSIELIQLMTAF
ncbi:Phosphopantothenoylcysteine decarboxylase / Phosphopantothenoylcysteine synthetase [uncultured Microcoleus sp.]|uniref:Phosphopantothenoylcysteine decarboxylase / Phosphopantothenoylcysteine synthetase n=1 Tax=uncultured Microcoleus sp. TaxID=259945 RepID=A0A6J4NHI6_9CYAN|nr:Phosphopantothenoylcysteine decarboxylase / Phosphopantothenoylcysteine synthetase [uncultured Microcoleus sp.]